jgi:hypothetical protein
MTAPLGIVIDHLYGNCPVQADGFIDGEPFYFRARGEHWSIEIGPGNTHLVVEAGDAARHNKSKDGSHETERDAHDRVAALPVWRYEEEYGGGKSYVAGWMTEEEARAFIAQAAERWRAEVAHVPS